MPPKFFGRWVSEPFASTMMMKKKVGKKKGKKWHDAVGDDDSSAKVWPAGQGEEDASDGGGKVNEDPPKPHPARQLGHALVDVGVAITFAEALQNSSTLYGVRSLARAGCRLRINDECLSAPHFTLSISTSR